MALVSDLTALCREYMAGFPPDDATNDAGNLIVLSIVNEAQSDVVRHGGVYAEETVVVNLAAGVARYAFDSTVYRINAATYFGSASDNRPLRETSLDHLDHGSRGWRQLDAGEPFQFFLDGANVGFFTTPNRTTVLGYPYVSLACVRAHAFVSVGDPLPANLPNLDAYLFPCLFRYCLRGQPDQMQVFIQLANAAGIDLKRFGYGRQVRQLPRIRPRVPRIR